MRASKWATAASAVLVAVTVSVPGLVFGPAAAGPLETVLSKVLGPHALQVDLELPHGPVIDAAGNLYISDSSHHRILEVHASNNRVTTLAGTGLPGFSGDGLPARLAQVNGPGDLALDPAGNLYFVDTFNHRVRKITGLLGPIKVITTVAGSSVTSGLDNGGFSGDGGPAILAELDTPQGVEVDSAGSIYIGDTYNHRIRKVDAVTGIINTVAGSGNFGSCCNGQFYGDGGPATAAGLYQPGPIAFDQAGNLFFSDIYNHRVRRVDKTTGIIDTIAGSGACCGASGSFSGDGGPATSATFTIPYGVAFDGAGNLFVADSCNHRVRKIDAATSIISTVAGSGPAAGSCSPGSFSGDGGPATLARFSFPYGVALHGSDLYIGDLGNDRIRKVNALGIIKTVVGSG